MTNATQAKTKPQLTHADLDQFTGDDIRYMHPLNKKVIYTPGVRYLAQEAQAYWLIDAIASYFGSDIMNLAMNKDSRLKSIQFWRLDVNDGKAVLTANADAGEEPFVRQDIAFTDFPLSEVEIWAGFDGSFWTLYLPSEH